MKQQIADFSKQLEVEELYSYLFEVKKSTEEILKGISYEELKKKVSDRKANLSICF